MKGNVSVELEDEIVYTGVDGALVPVVVTAVLVDTGSGAVTTAETTVWSITGVSVANGRVTMDDVLVKVNATDASVEVVVEVITLADIAGEGVILLPSITRVASIMALRSLPLKLSASSISCSTSSSSTITSISSSCCLIISSFSSSDILHCSNLVTMESLSTVDSIVSYTS